MNRADNLLILKTGLLAGLLDILAASANFYFKTGGNPVMVLKFVASGVFGNAALSGGTDMAIWGLVFHFLIALLFAAFFFLVVGKLIPARTSKVVAGILYGIFIWLVMNLMIVPLSNTPKLPLNATSAILNISILIVCVGLPISYSYFNYYKTTR